MFSNKIFLSVVIPSGLGAASIGGYKMFAPKTIRDKLVFYGREIPLDENHMEQWKKLLQKYKSTGGTKPFGELNLEEGTEKETKNIETLQDECLKLFRTELTDPDIDKKIEKTRDWCLLSSKNLKD